MPKITWKIQIKKKTTSGDEPKKIHYIRKWVQTISKTKIEKRSTREYNSHIENSLNLGYNSGVDRRIFVWKI